MSMKQRKLEYFKDKYGDKQKYQKWQRKAKEV